jgi:outer membrane protein OmpA-like peptidoglycan-associated protein
MNYYQNNIRAGIIFFIFVFSNINCFNQEVSVHSLKINTSNRYFDIYAPFLDSRSNHLIWTQRNVSSYGDTIDKLYFTNFSTINSYEHNNIQQFDISDIPYSISSIGTCNISLDGATIAFGCAKINKDTNWYIILGKRVNKQYQYSATIDSGKSWMGHPCLSINDSMIIFSAIKKINSKSDLYFSKKIKEDKWTFPEPLSDIINTEFDEISPFLTYRKNNLLLYFSSDRPTGKGGLDIYFSYYDFPSNTWSKPNPVPFINSKYDDAFPSVPHDTSAENNLLFASNRNENRTWGIYTAFPNPLPPMYIIVEGSVFDASEKNHINPIINSNVIFRDFNSSKKLSILSTDSLGHYIAKMPLDIKLYVEAFASGKASRDTLVYYSSETLKNMQRIQLDFFLKDTFRLITDTVFFDYKKADLKINSSVELILQRISDYLKMYPNNQIKILGHTDKFGGYDYNLDLSLRRALAVVDTLINRGIDKSSFLFEGKAYLQPLPGFENCDKVDECAPNRRVEIIYLYRKE